MKRQSTRYRIQLIVFFTNNLMKRESFRAMRGMGENEYRQGLRVIIYWNIKASALRTVGGKLNSWRTRYNKSSSFSNNVIKCENFHASRRNGQKWIQTRIKSREWYIESSSFFNNLMKRQSFRAMRGGRGIWFKQGLRVENGLTNRLLSLII